MLGETNLYVRLVVGFSKPFSINQSDVVYMRVYGLWPFASLLLFSRGCQNSRETFSAESEARCLHLTKKERKSFGGAFQAPLARLKWRRILSEKLYLLLLSLLLLLSSFWCLFLVYYTYCNLSIFHSGRRSSHFCCRDGEWRRHSAILGLSQGKRNPSASGSDP